MGRDENLADATSLLSQAMTEYKQVDAALQLECNSEGTLNGQQGTEKTHV